jgi:hypothetical protein
MPYRCHGRRQFFCFPEGPGDLMIAQIVTYNSKHKYHKLGFFLSLRY